MRKHTVRKARKAKKGIGPYLASHPAVLVAAFVLAFIATAFVLISSKVPSGY